MTIVKHVLQSQRISSFPWETLSVPREWETKVLLSCHKRSSPRDGDLEYGHRRGRVSVFVCVRGEEYTSTETLSTLFFSVEDPPPVKFKTEKGRHMRTSSMCGETF